MRSLAIAFLVALFVLPATGCVVYSHPHRHGHVAPRRAHVRSGGRRHSVHDRGRHLGHRRGRGNPHRDR